MTNEKLILEETQECKLVLNTPYATIKTDRYIVFAKTAPDKDGNTNRIEVNGLDLDEIIEFNNRLGMIILENKDRLR